MDMTLVGTAIAAVLGGSVAITAVQAVTKALQPLAPTKPNKDKHPEVAQSSEDTENFLNIYNYYTGRKLTNDEFSEEKIMPTLERICAFIDHRFDCADFRIQMLFRIYKDCYDKLSEEMRELIKKTCLGFKYFMDEPGADSMCYWSENHQLLFAVSEYLSGQEWKEEVFTNDGCSGEQHLKRAKHRIESWMKQRFEFGFSEFLSNVYLVEDLAPMSNFIEYCEDEKLKTQMKIIMDTLWCDIALHTCDNRLVAASSRMYGSHKTGNYSGNSLSPAMNLLWGKQNFEKAENNPNYSREKLEYLKNSLKKNVNYMGMNFIAMVEKGEYILPEIIREIALCDDEIESKMSCGLSAQDMKENDLIGQEPHQIMAQLGAETFTQPEVIKNTVKYVTHHNLKNNASISYFKYLDLFILPKFVLPFIFKHLNLMTHGIALGRGNVYSYKTKDFAMTTLMKNDVDLCGTQEHIWSANIAENLTLYTTHPSRDDGVYGSSPGYFIGNGRKPMSVQDKDVNLTIYKIPKRVRPAEFKLSKITHAYMPKCFYDEFELNGNCIFARRDNVFVAFISNGELKFRPFKEKPIKAIYKGKKPKGEMAKKYLLDSEFDLVREGGEYHCYVTELSSADKETFDEFKKRISNNKLKFENGSISYNSKGKQLYTSYKGEFKINDVDVSTNYLRFDNPWCKVARQSEQIEFIKGEKKLTLNFDKAERIID